MPVVVKKRRKRRWQENIKQANITERKQSCERLSTYFLQSCSWQLCRSAPPRKKNSSPSENSFGGFVSRRSRTLFFVLIIHERFLCTRLRISSSVALWGARTVSFASFDTSRENVFLEDRIIESISIFSIAQVALTGEYSWQNISHIGQCNIAGFDNCEKSL